MGQPGGSVPQDVSRSAAGLAVAVKAAIFDLDGTLLPATSAEREFVRFVLHTGKQTVPQAVRALLSWFAHVPSRGLRSNKTHLRGIDIDHFTETAAAFCRQHLARRIPEQTRDMIEAHRQGGDILGILSGAPQLLIEPLKDLLELDFVIGTGLACKRGRLTGDLDDPRLSGPEKVRRAQEVARACGFSLRHSAAYANAFEDRFLLAAVARPRVVNPDRRLARLARKNGWPISICP